MRIKITADSTCDLGAVLLEKYDITLATLIVNKGGEAFIEACKKVLAEEYAELSINIVLPDENSRRVGQSVAAAGLPEIK